MGVKMQGSREQGGKNVREQGAHIINLGSREQRSGCEILSCRIFILMLLQAMRVPVAM